MVTKKKGERTARPQDRWKTLKEPINIQTSQTETNKDTRKDKHESLETEGNRYCVNTRNSCEQTVSTQLVPQLRIG